MNEQDPKQSDEMGHSKPGALQPQAGQSRATQTWIIAGAVVVSAVGYAGWQASNRDYLSMAPMTRCEYGAYRSKYGWESKQACQAGVANTSLRGVPFPDYRSSVYP